MSGYHYTQWLDIATAGILDPHERESARQELLDHMEDRAEERIAKGVPRYSALNAACTVMGDPHEVGQLLRKAHQPVLTRLLQLTKKAVILLAIVTVCSTLLFSDWYPRLGWLKDLFTTPETTLLTFQTDPLPDHVNWRMIVTPKASTRAGDYKASVRRVSITAPRKETDSWYISMELQFKPRWFWQPDAIPFYDFTLRSQDWECRSDMEYPYDLYLTSHEGLMHIDGCFPTLPEELELEYWGPQNRFTLPIDLSGGVVYEK
jgi:hypothetical protein